MLFNGSDRDRGDNGRRVAVTQLVDNADWRTAWEFLQHMPEAVPYQVHTLLTDNGIQFAEQPKNRNTLCSRQMRFNMICEGSPLSAVGPDNGERD